jgi:hypothetical protein
LVKSRTFTRLKSVNRLTDLNNQPLTFFLCFFASIIDRQALGVPESDCRSAAKAALGFVGGGVGARGLNTEGGSQLSAGSSTALAGAIVILSSARARSHTHTHTHTHIHTHTHARARVFFHALTRTRFVYRTHSHFVAFTHSFTRAHSHTFVLLSRCNNQHPATLALSSSAVSRPRRGKGSYIRPVENDKSAALAAPAPWHLQKPQQCVTTYVGPLR